jgi:hypothetical protein
VNQVVLWDRIITDRDDAVFDEKALRAEYILTDQGYHLRLDNCVVVVVLYLFYGLVLLLLLLLLMLLFLFLLFLL